MKRVELLAAAREEIRAATRWYESRRRGLGLEFIAVLDEALEAIATHPEASPVWRPERTYRKRGIRRFPYVVFFDVAGEVVTVIAVAHQRRRPGYWLERTPR